MNKKLLIGAVLLLTSGSILGATGHGYRILKEEYHGAPGVNFHVEEVSPGTTALMTKKGISTGATSTLIPNRFGKLGQIAQIDGYHHISVTNTSQVQKQIYEYKIYLACTTAQNYFSRFIELYPGGAYTTDEHSYAAITGSTVGNYPIIGSTSVANAFFNHASNGVGMLYIIK